MLDANFIDFDSSDSTTVELTSTTHWTQARTDNPWEIDFAPRETKEEIVLSKEELDVNRVSSLCDRRVELLVREHVESHLTTGQIERRARIRMIDEELDVKLSRVSDEEWQMLTDFQEELDALKE